MRRIPFCLIAGIGLSTIFLSSAHAHQTSIINMPDARVDPDGTMNIGVSRNKPFAALYGNLSFLSWLELTGSITRVDDVLGFRRVDNFHPEYGNYKDKSMDVKAVLWKETDYLPNVAIGSQDFMGTQLYNSRYIVGSKKIGDFDITVGYGQARLDGIFAGVRYNPKFLKNWRLVAEYDVYDYAHDKQAVLSHTDTRRKTLAAGVEYKYGPFNVQVSRGHGEFNANAYVKIPFDVKEYIPKFQEPPPFTKVLARPWLKQWNTEPVHRRSLMEALHQQNFRGIDIRYINGKLVVSLTNTRISSLPRAVGRAARTILAFAPIETREIEITYTTRGIPLVTYDFYDASMLQRYFNGTVSRQALAARVEILYPRNESADTQNVVSDRDEMLSALDASVVENGVRYAHEGDLISYRNEDSDVSNFTLKPGLSLYLNDPNDPFRYAISAIASYDRKLGEGTFLQSTASYNLIENISDVSAPSNSELPHVRSDFTDYYRDTRGRLYRFLVNKFFMFDERVYARATAGIYETMFAGAGGQVLYIPHSEPWAVDFSLDALHQRDTKGLLGFRNYSTVTALGALHYRLPYGLTATVRGGRFLARDWGARFEMKRRFESGIEFGAWYTLTNGHDVTDPGSPERPYNDKGIFLSLPFGPILPYDTQASSTLSIAPWTRDVGQMVDSPGDLYDMVDRPLFRQVYQKDGLSEFGDVNDDYHLPSLGTSIFDRPLMNIAKRDAFDTASTIASSDTVKKVGLGIGLILAASLADTRVDKFAQEHGESGSARKLIRVGKLLPVIGVAGAGLLSLGGGTDTRLSSTGLAAVEAAGVGVLTNLGLKYVAGRSRPNEGLGDHDFHPGKRGNSDASFPSMQTTVVWAAVTPFAKEYDAPWLYGLAALTNISRIMERKHWLSDTVAGSLLGYGLGSMYWNMRLKDWEGNLQLNVGPNSVQLSIPIK